MKEKTNLSSALQASSHIFRNRNGQTLYMTKKEAYLITPDKERTLQLYAMRWLYALILGILLYVGFGLNLWLVLAVCTAFGLFLEWRWRTFLKGCVQYSRKKAMAARPADKEPPRNMLWLRAALYGAFGILLAADTFAADWIQGNAPMTAVCWGVAVFFLYISGKYIYMALRKGEAI